MGGGGHITIVNYLIVAESIKYQHNSNIGMQANRCCCSFQAKTSQQAQPPGVDICTVYWPCQAIFSASCYFKLASGVFCVTKFKRVDVDMFILIRSKKYASLYTTRVCAGIFRLPISIGNQVSRDNLETVGPI